MPHHSSQDDYMREVQRKLAEQVRRQVHTMDQAVEAHEETMQRLGNRTFGATGHFPEGQLHPTDEGQIRFGVAAHEGKVLLDFGGPVAWMGLDPDDADSLAQSLQEKARQARRQRHG